MLTPRQKQILDFIQDRIEKKGVAPTQQEIARHFKLSSVATIHEHIEALESKGFLNKKKGQARAISLKNKDGDLVSIPLLGIIAAGQPIEAIENREAIAVPRTKLEYAKDVYALRVEGNSMIDENINDGDVVLVRSQSTAQNGDKVVALIDQDSVTLKKFYKEKGRVRLQPANQAMLPIFVEPARVTIQGIVIDVIRNSDTEAGRTIEETILHTIPAAKRPKGGCELIYRGKARTEDILANTVSAKLKTLRTYGRGSNNRLIHGDNLGIMKSLLDSGLCGKIDLIYIDPPFGTGQEFIGFDETKNYSDKIMDADFLEFLRQRLVFLHQLLSEHGSIYVHIDQKVGHYVKIILDEIFGEENFRNDITRIKCNPKNFERKAYGNIKDVIFFYSKSKPNGNDPMRWNDYRLPLTEEDIAKQFPKIDKTGQRYATTPLHAKGETINGPTGKEWKGLKPPRGRHWRYAPSELTRLDDARLIEWSSNGNPRKIIYAEENRGRKIQDIWDLKDPGFEGSLYPTQKNDILLELLIQNSTEKNSLVLDCFAGSGTTLIAAQKLGRQWIGIDANKNATDLIEERMLSLSEKPNFAICQG